jgi:erythromycin esterase-like protein
LIIRDIVSESHRIVLWAHHSHINHHSSGEGIPSMGQQLLASIGAGLYTLGLFAGQGEAIEVNDGADSPFVVTPLAAAGDFEIESSLQALAKFDYFLDLSLSSELPQALRQLSTGRMELGGRWPFVVERDFHAVVFLHKVHAPEPFATEARSAPKVRQK